MMAQEIVKYMNYNFLIEEIVVLLISSKHEHVCHCIAVTPIQWSNSMKVDDICREIVEDNIISHRKLRPKCSTDYLIGKRC